jgi:hypothetical protein
MDATKENYDENGMRKKPKKIDKKDAEKMHRLYKEGKSVAKIATWVRYDAAELIRIITENNAEKVRFFLGANPDTQTRDGKDVPIIIMQLERGLGILPEFLHFVPGDSEDICPLPEDCNIYSDSE